VNNDEAGVVCNIDATIEQLKGTVVREDDRPVARRTTEVSQIPKVSVVSKFAVGPCYH
jgi:hypothetical protein